MNKKIYVLGYLQFSSLCLYLYLDLHYIEDSLLAKILLFLLNNDSDSFPILSKMTVFCAVTIMFLLFFKIIYLFIYFLCFGALVE